MFRGICLAHFYWRSAFHIRYHLNFLGRARRFLELLPRAINLMRTHRSRHAFTTLALLSVLCIPGALAKNSTQIVVVPVTNMYSGPSDQTDVVSQAIYGSNVTLQTARGEWSRIQTADHYQGWVPSRHLRLVQNGSGYATSGTTVQVESLFANLYHEPDVTKHKPLLTVPFEVRLETIPEDAGDEKKASATGKLEGWLQVRLPDKRSAWIQSSEVASDLKPLSIPESIELGKRFLGLPYLWGGTSSFGFDCSGFTQMLVRARGINMPRDADKQAEWSGVVAVDRKDVRPGDLLFFGSSARNIDHTGMYVGDGQFIQDTTNGHPVVQISRLDDEPWTHRLVALRRVK
jgi:gamma-D-glutamyl-L-lysine dipeptidyl-peptidase